MTKVAGLSVLKWLGSEHAHYNMGLFTPDASSLTADDIAGLLGEVARRTGAVAAILTAQPFAWDSVPVPSPSSRTRARRAAAAQ
jgi:CelD/BcsL family acetyltransferase involved in cellulose biosynthesis